MHLSVSSSEKTRESGLDGEIAAKKPALRKSSTQKRFVWAKKHKEWKLDQCKSVLWSCVSKSEICGSTCCIFVWRRKGKQMVCKYLVPTVTSGRGGVVGLGGAWLVTLLGIYSKLEDTEPALRTALPQQWRVGYSSIRSFVFNLSISGNSFKTAGKPAWSLTSWSSSRHYQGRAKQDSKQREAVDRKKKLLCVISHSPNSICVHL